MVAGSIDPLRCKENSTFPSCLRERTHTGAKHFEKEINWRTMPSGRNGTILRKCLVGNFVIPRQNNAKQRAKLEWNNIELAQSAAADEVHLFQT